jgi:hypothetical protein
MWSSVTIERGHLDVSPSTGRRFDEAATVELGCGGFGGRVHWTSPAGLEEM